MTSVKLLDYYISILKKCVLLKRDIYSVRGLESAKSVLKKMRPPLLKIKGKQMCNFDFSS